MTKDQKNDNEKIYVCVRKRPLNANEIKKDEKNAIYIKGKKTIEVHEHKLKLDLTKYINYHYFTFDYAFDCDASNIDVYRQTGSSLIEHVFNGGTATYFSYGQTGSGKTYTMMNPEQGLFILAAKDIFKLLKKEKYSFISLYISFYEIYQGQLYDLLNNKKKVYARENNNQQVCIQGLSEYECFSEEKLMEIFMNGINNRVTSTTGSNPDSSRSHGIFQVVLKDKTKKNLPIYGKFIFIDLAGSERGADRDDTNKQTLLEGQEINKSLLALKECIRAIDRESKYTPFRQSKLTQVLKDSFIGNSKTCMITTISPSSLNIDHTLNTLRYAHR
ncbi:kinesin-domain-containing protein [Neocallimastix lanati (nom. inval.)]|uniref:Kinesin-like protein n=1 Tax=Neocallimastix californiae TaxID=1754190 RepID=A0A1Y2BU46_9FUNG|nr:kinesin-domain-containing protein [Neocallimastix sp. JGI-2020a]ORY38263.1 kinesin-domain-containing protein [Neocallimastix californiae]|eukprot:ORY38263.1 kinesin-domain-containing protein [Neocallimastix californiae]